MVADLANEVGEGEDTAQCFYQLAFLLDGTLTVTFTRRWILPRIDTGEKGLQEWLQKVPKTVG